MALYDSAHQVAPLGAVRRRGLRADAADMNNVAGVRATCHGDQREPGMRSHLVCMELPILPEGGGAPEHGLPAEHGPPYAAWIGYAR